LPAHVGAGTGAGTGAGVTLAGTGAGAGVGTTAGALAAGAGVTGVRFVESIGFRIDQFKCRSRLGAGTSIPCISCADTPGLDLTL
jgi:hypothetical protein